MAKKDDCSSADSRRLTQIFWGIGIVSVGGGVAFLNMGHGGGGGKSLKFDHGSR